MAAKNAWPSVARDSPLRRLTAHGESVSVRAVKLILPLLAVTFFVTACANENATRRGFYSPPRASGPYTRSLEDGTWQQGGKPVDVELHDRREQAKINALQAKPAAKAE